jgi:hypothetical protein
LNVRKLSPLFALFLAACPETVGQQCPPNSLAIGNYSLAFAGLHAADECRVVVGPDGGPADASMAADDGGTKSATLCSGADGDGGTLLYLAIPGKGQRLSTFFTDGGFHFTGASPPTSGTACVCPVGVDETFDGILTGAWDGSFPLGTDGGLPLVTGLQGTLVDHLTSSATSGCLCNPPCSVSYAVTGTRF